VGALGLLVIIVLSLAVPFRYWKAEANYRTAVEHLRKDRLVLARDYLTKYLDVHPNSFVGHLLLAQISRRAHRYGEAEIQLDICEILPGPAEDIQLERLLSVVQKGDLAGAESLWSRAKQYPDQAGEIYRALSQGYRKNYLLINMRRCLDAWLELEPGNEQALLQRGWVRERQNDYPGALEAYQQALEAAPDCHDARLRKAQALLFLKRPREALNDLETLWQINSADPEVGLALVQCWLGLARMEEAGNLLDELVQKNPKEFPLLLEKGRLALEQGQLEQAESWLRRAVERMPRDQQAHYHLSLALARLGKKKEAEQFRARLKEIEADLELMSQLTARLQKQPSDPDLRCEIGKVFLRAAEDQEALLWLHSALRADPSHAPSHLVLAQYYEQHRQPELARRHRKKASP
jgi:tetratricopeptide (TPR) repeat protein